MLSSNNTTTTTTAQTQQTNVPKATILEGKYLSIERPRFREGGTSGDSVTGTILTLLRREGKRELTKIQNHDEHNQIDIISAMVLSSLPLPSCFEYCANRETHLTGQKIDKRY